jgi:hypothetical protein
MLTDRINLNEKLRYCTEALKRDGRTHERGDRTRQGSTKCGACGQPIKLTPEFAALVRALG